MEFQSGLAGKNNNISSKAIRKKVKNSESIALKRYHINNNVLLDLDMVLNDVYSSFRPVSADYDMRKDLVNSLNAMALDIFGNCKDSSPVLEAYGSFVMDMFSRESDLDVSINFGNGTSEMPRETKLQVLRWFAEKLRSLQEQGYVKDVESILGARVPIVKFFDQGTAVECDLSVENKGGILNSQIIRIISKIDDRFQKLCMLVKHWAKAHKVNSALHQTLNSVSFTLLVAHHLQTQNPPILPPFSVLCKDGIDPSSVEKRTQNFLNWGCRNQESLGRLFTTFFVKLQSVEFLWRQGLCVSVMNGLWISKNWKKAVISIEDFTDVSQNVARRVNSQGATKIYGSINRTVEDLFEFLDGKISGTHLRHRLFGQQAVVEPPRVYPQKPQKIYKIGYIGYIGVLEEHQNKRVCLENDYRAVQGTSRGREDERYENPIGRRNRYVGNCNGFDRTSHGREEERYENPLGKQNRYAGNCNGFEGTGHGREEERYENLIGKRKRYAGYSSGSEELHEIRRSGIHNNPLDNPYRQVPLNGHLVHPRHDGGFVDEEPMPVYPYRVRYENSRPQPYLADHITSMRFA